MATRQAAPGKPRSGDKAKLSLDTLRDLADGQAEATINAALKAALRDVEDRGDDKKPRKVVIEIELRKLGEDMVSAAVKAKTTLPPYQTKPTYGGLKVEGQTVDMTFNPNSADNPDQKTLPIPEDDEAE